MKLKVTLGIAAAGLLLLGSAPAAAQSGFALKGGLVFNSSDVDRDVSNMELQDAAGFHLGAEMVLPLGLGVGVSGYTTGSPDDFDTGSGSLVVLGEANYFLNLPILPVTPYAGVHTGLGTLHLEDVEGFGRPEVDFGDLGWQVGVRFQPLPILGVDAQYRRVSGSLEGAQGAGFETNQFLIGVALF